VNRIVRIKERCADLFGQPGSRIRVLRTSNDYQFNDPKGAASKGFPSKSDFPSGTTIQDFPSLLLPPAPLTIDPSTDLGAALLRFRAILRPTAERK